MNKKILIGSIIAVVMLTIPVSTAIDIETVVDTKSSENSEIGTLDSYSEIFSIIFGDCINIEIVGIGLIRSAEIWGGPWDGGVSIIGLKFPIFDPQNNRFTVDLAKHVSAPRFIGFHFKIADNPYTEAVWGIALGNIEWS